jgi:hypothetical protein
MSGKSCPAPAFTPTSSAPSWGVRKLRNRCTNWTETPVRNGPKFAPVPYEVLVTRSSVVAVDGFHVRVAAVSDVIAAKTFANRAKDLDALPELMVIEREAEPRSPSASFFSASDAGDAARDQQFGLEA